MPNWTNLCITILISLSCGKLVAENNTSLQEHKRADQELSMAMKTFDFNAVRLALRHGADPNLDMDNKMTPLTMTAERGELDPLRLLLASGANVNKLDKSGVTPLLNLLYSRSKKTRHLKLTIVELMLKKGADPNLRGIRAYAPLDATTNYELVKALVSKGARVNDPPVKTGITPLMMASGVGNEKTVQFLLSKGANVNAVDKHGTNVLFWAKTSNNKRIVAILRAAGAKELNHAR